MSQRQRKNMELSKNYHKETSHKLLENVEYTAEPPSYKKDLPNILLLLFLYLLQGIPLGLAGSIPMILQQKNISYKDQATFSLAFWPFSIKILWAPIVDSVFWGKLGRRKSWLVPSQYLIGMFMFVLSYNINTMIGDNGDTPYVFMLTSVFFCLNFLAATQDIAVDGWCLTMLSKENIGWTSTCNSVGQTAGFFLGYVVFLALESKEFCVQYLGQNDSLVTLPGFFMFWGVIFIITTTLVLFMKKEKNYKEEHNDGEIELNMVGTYKVLWDLLKMPALQSLIVILLTAKIGFACADSLTVLKLTEAGVPKDRLALLSIPLTPIQIFLPLYISKFTAGERPMDIFLKAYLPRLFFGLVFAGMVFITPLFKDLTGHFPFYYYLLIVAMYLLHQICANCMFVAQMAFFAKVSDPKIGGTYMTLLNTFTNLGSNWPAWFALRYVSELTWTSCQLGQVETCNTPSDKTACESGGGLCSTSLDGYYLESVILVIIGVFWYMMGSNVIRNLQNLPKNSWKIKFADKSNKSFYKA